MGQAEAGSAVRHRDLIARLAELLEDVRQTVGRNADAGVADDDLEGHRFVGTIETIDDQGDEAAVREFHRVHHQVRQHLTDLRPIADQPFPHRL